MEGAIRLTAPQQQSAWASRIIGVLFNHQTMEQDLTHLGRGNHPLRTRHLPHGVWQEEDTLRRSRSNLFHKTPSLCHAAAHPHPNGRRASRSSTERIFAAEDRLMFAAEDAPARFVVEGTVGGKVYRCVFALAAREVVYPITAFRIARSRRRKA